MIMVPLAGTRPCSMEITSTTCRTGIYNIKPPRGESKNIGSKYRRPIPRIVPRGIVVVGMIPSTFMVPVVAMRRCRMGIISTIWWMDIFIIHTRAIAITMDR
jgi:hypothetical protein